MGRLHFFFPLPPAELPFPSTLFLLFLSNHPSHSPPTFTHPS